jgi:hypothetical protein
MNKTQLLHNLDRWQASSHPDLAMSKPRELFERKFARRYCRLQDDLWRRMTRLHGTLYSLEELKDFPFDYLHAPGEMEFWRLVVENFLDFVVVTLYGLLIDTGPDVHTLPAFRDDIVRAEWRCQEKYKLLKLTLRQRRFDQVCKSITKRVDGLRNAWIAHRLIDKQSGSPKEALASVSFAELKRLFQAAHSLFGAISFGSTYATLGGDLMPTTRGGQPTPTCLQTVLMLFSATVLS